LNAGWHHIRAKIQEEDHYGSLKINAGSVKLPDGRDLSAASSGEQGYTGQ